MDSGCAATAYPLKESKLLMEAESVEEKGEPEKPDVQ